MKLYFNIFLARIKLTRNLDDIIKFIQKHPDLSRNQVKVLLSIVREEHSTYHMLEIAKYAHNLSLNDIYIIGCNIARTGTSNEAFQFLKVYSNERELNYVLIKKICKDSNILCMIKLITSMKNISDEYHETIMSLIIEKSPLDILFHFIQNNTQEFSKRSLDLIIERLNKEYHPYYIWLFSCLFRYYKTDTLAHIITLTNNSKYLYYFLKSNPNLDLESVQDIVCKLIEIGSLKYMKDCLFNCTNLSSSNRLQLFDRIREIENRSDNSSKDKNTKVYGYSIKKRNIQSA